MAIAEIEETYGQAPGWFTSLTRRQRARLLAWRHFKAERNA